VTRAEWPADDSEPLLELTTGQLLRDAAAQVPERDALVTKDRRWTYAQLLDDAERQARALASRFAPGERIAAYANNLPEWVILEFAAGLAGLTVVTVNPALRERELTHVLGKSQAAGVLMVDEYRGTDMKAMLAKVKPPSVRHVFRFGEELDGDADLPTTKPTDPALILFTSGTTGLPKGAVLRHRGIVNNAGLTHARMGLQPGFTQLTPMPLFHTAGCAMAVIGTICHQGTLVLPPYFDPALMLELIARERPQVTGGVPTMLIAMLEHPDFATTDVSSIEVLVSGGAVVPPALVTRVELAFKAPLSIVFAQTESSPVITQTAPTDSASDRANTLGTPLPRTAVKIVDPATGATAGHDEVGEICTRGYHVMTGYLDDPEATKAAIDEDGWLHTGDLGSMDKRGYCRIGGRLKDMIIRGGMNIYPSEIEQVLFEHPDVADVAVVGIPDEKWGEQVVAFIRPAEGRTPDPDTLHAYCREQLAPHKTPRFWEFVDAFPMTGSGKVQKFALREQFTLKH
jgi:acyl-CoA synthetase (AMP-forming)/AMP-acid ligase II